VGEAVVFVGVGVATGVEGVGVCDGVGVLDFVGVEVGVDAALDFVADGFAL
jgi:hypothetical protein